VTRSRALASVAAAAACGAGLCGLAGCPSTVTTSLYTPITGFAIDSQTLTAGLGCGTAPGEVYKYAAIVTLTDGTLVSGVFDCFTNAQFSNLPTPDGGTTNYAVAVYAYDFAAFVPAKAIGQCADLDTDAACPGENPLEVLKYTKLATWTAKCTATQVQGMSQVAVCTTLLAQGVVLSDAGEAGLPGAQASIAVDTQAFVGAEGGTLRCMTDFDHVRASVDAGPEAAVVACPAPAVISPVIPGTGYVIAATLVRGDAAIATSSCQAVAAADAGAPVVATCGPAGP
jgi:hypothetical protein